jgi:hypothetical protein
MRSFTRLITVYLLCLFGLLVLYGNTLKTYIPSGDDLYMISGAPTTFASFIGRFGDFSGQYRPLGALFFNISKPLIPHYALMFLHNLTLFAWVPTLLFTLLRRFTSTIIATLLTFTVMISPVMFYHIFALAGLNNTLVLISALLLTYIALETKRQKHLWTIIISVGVWIVTIGIKETFLLHSFLLSIISCKAFSKKISAYCMLGIWIVTFGFIAVHMLSYKQVDPNYSFIFTTQQIVTNMSLIIPWLINFPRGWQYGAPLPRSIFAFPIILVWISTMALVVGLIRKNSRKHLALIIVALVISLSPYLFLSRVLTYYLDATVCIIIFSIAYGIRHIPVGRGIAIISVFCLAALAHFLIISPQWHTYSFVANANETAHNFVQTVRASVRLDTDTVCIVNHSKGGWATQDGQLIHFVYLDRHIKVISTTLSSPPSVCRKQSAVTLVNDDRKYRIYTGK